MLKKFQLILKWIVELFRPCPIISKKSLTDKHFLIIGHRGSPTKEIENTIRSFEIALDDGANALEMDLCITKDERVIIWHDWNPDSTDSLLREAGFEPWLKYKPSPPPIFNELRKPVNELLYEEFVDNYDYKDKETSELANADIPTLEQVFEWSVNQKKLKYLFLDIKVPANESHLAVIILQNIKYFVKKYNPEFRIVIETTEKTILDKMKLYYKDFIYCLDIEPPPGFIFDPVLYSSVKEAIKNNNKAALALRPRKITFANWTTYRRIIRYDLKLLRKFNKKNPKRPIENVFGATVNKTKEMKCLVKLGIHGLQTDFPHRLKELIKKDKNIIKVQAAKPLEMD